MSGCFPDMPTANIHDRRSIERIYSRDDFAVDAAANQQQPANEFLRGVRIVSAPDAAGIFEVEPARHHVGEIAGLVFLTPFRPLVTAETVARNTGSDKPRTGYDAFIDAIIAAAPRFGFQAADAPGPGDPRLRGPRQ